MARLGGIALDDRDRYVTGKQHLRQIVTDGPAADQHHALDFVRHDPEVAEQRGQVVRGSGNEDPVALFQSKLPAVRRVGHALAQNRADQRAAVDQSRQIGQRLIAQFALPVDLEFHDLEPSVREGIALQKAREFQKTVDLDGGLPFGIEGHGKSEPVPHLVDLPHVFGVVDAGDGMQFSVHGVGGQAGQQVEFVGTRRGDEQIGGSDARVAQRLHRGAVALQRHHVVLARRRFQNRGVTVDQDQIVPLVRQFLGQRLAYFAVTGNQDFHYVILPNRK